MADIYIVIRSRSFETVAACCSITFFLFTDAALDKRLFLGAYSSLLRAQAACSLNSLGCRNKYSLTSRFIRSISARYPLADDR